MKINYYGRCCLLCGKEIKPASRFNRDGDEVKAIKPKKAPTRYVHRECYKSVPKVGKR